MTRPDHAARGSLWLVCVAAALALLRRPALWGAASLLILRMARPGWWRHWPPRPFPPAEYAHFRLQTMYGGDGHLPATPAPVSGSVWSPVQRWSEAQRRADELVGYVDWCHRLAALAR